MKKSAILRPVSQKAYDRFVKRIYLVVTNKTKREAMLAALDSYLDGNRDTYDRNLTPDCVMVFGMLRFEIELAMIRSAKARTRARRKQTEPEIKPPIMPRHRLPTINLQRKPLTKPNPNLPRMIQQKSHREYRAACVALSIA